MPFVVLLPASERESLRNSGVIPAGFFRSFGVESSEWDDLEGPANASSVYLWPYDLDYAGSSDLVARLADNPADIPAFFGMESATDDNERRHNERLVMKLLGAVCVHVVFLDRKKDGGGYAAFESFSQIAEWSRNFRRALDVRFPNEPEFRNAENVLVIVARGQQVKASEAELDDFRKTIGTSPDCAFRSCYYMDYNLRVGKTGHVVHAADIWNVMVARLLLSFVLSREETVAAGGATRTNWQRPGIKLWRSQECFAGVNLKGRNAFLDKALGLANSLLQQMLHSEDMRNVPLLVDNDGDGASLAELEKISDDGDEPSWRTGKSPDWYDFSGRDCAEGTCDVTGKRWSRKFDSAREGFCSWWMKNRPGDDLPSSSDVFEMTRKSPQFLLAGVEQLLKVLGSSRKRVSNLSGGGERSAGKQWERVVQVEAERRRLLEKLESDAGEFDRARAHYAGWMPSVMVFSAVSVMLGWVVHRLVMALGGGLGTSLLLAAAAAAGAASAVALILSLHSRAGRRGRAALIADSLKADKKMVERDCRVRDMVEAAMELRRQLALRARRFRVWSLLSRTKAIVQTEIQNKNATATLYDDEEVEEENVGEADRDSVRRGFCRATCQRFGDYLPDMSPDTMVELMHRVETWWSVRNGQEAGSRSDNFMALWSRLCAKDQMSEGYYPARTFAREIRDFVSRFSQDIRRMEEELVIRDNLADLRQKTNEWFHSLIVSDVYQFATGAVNGLHVNERQQLSPVVYFENNENLIDFQLMNEVARTHGSLVAHFRPIGSDTISRMPQLAFMFQEYVVELGSDDETGRLVFMEVGDAN